MEWQLFPILWKNVHLLGYLCNMSWTTRWYMLPSKQSRFSKREHLFFSCFKSRNWQEAHKMAIQPQNSPSKTRARPLHLSGTEGGSVSKSMLWRRLSKSMVSDSGRMKAQLLQDARDNSFKQKESAWRSSHKYVLLKRCVKRSGFTICCDVVRRLLDLFQLLADLVPVLGSLDSVLIG